MRTLAALFALLRVLSNEPRAVTWVAHFSLAFLVSLAFIKWPWLIVVAPALYYLVREGEQWLWSGPGDLLDRTLDVLAPVAACLLAWQLFVWRLQ